MACVVTLSVVFKDRQQPLCQGRCKLLSCQQGTICMCYLKLKVLTIDTSDITLGGRVLLKSCGKLEFRFFIVFLKQAYLA